MRYILPEREEPNEWPAQLSNVIAHCAAEHRITSFERVEYCTLGHGSRNIQLYFAVNPRQRAQMGRQYNANHGRVCTSTESTPGRSRTMGFQLSPPLADA